MNISDVLNLISSTWTLDEYGVRRKTEISRQVYCEAHSVTQTEFFAGSQAGLKPDLRFTVFNADYANEEILEFHGVRYSIYRTYNANSDYIELYAQKAAGVSNGINNNNSAG